MTRRSLISMVMVAVLSVASCSGVADDPSDGAEGRGVATEDRPTEVICMSVRSAEQLAWRRLRMESGGCSDEYIQTATGAVTRQVPGVPCTCPTTSGQKPRCVFGVDQGWFKPSLVIMRYDDGDGSCIDRRVTTTTGVALLWPAESCDCPAQSPAEPPAADAAPSATDPEAPTCYCDELCIENGDCCSGCG